MGFQFTSLNNGVSGRSGGLVSIWDPNLFRAQGMSKDRNFLHIWGQLVGSNLIINIINVYAPQRVSDKKVLWSALSEVINSGNGMWVLLGDFHAVRSREERKKSRFNSACAKEFNEFIDRSDLIEYNMKGRSFTFMAPNSNKISKIDRILVCKFFFDKWPDACLRALPRIHADHSSVVLIFSKEKFGVKPFGFFNSWLERDDIEEVVENTVNSFDIVADRPDVRLILKLRFIRDKIKDWRKDLMNKEKEDMVRDKEELDALDRLCEERDLSEEEEWIKEECIENIKEREWWAIMDSKQKSRCKWAVDGDENSSFFHRLCNNRKKNGIPGLMIGGSWVSKPEMVKREILNFFRNHFGESMGIRL
ncbi:uncharacterized protein LOC110900496 [Helianthus annuus]|uniref:uncharacterized protein LOC110900496 n=1 Tax=Helianthus annuus TaxID=4232 RepID=UPI000B906083|nr:uncharacterized protein LOC110900496 [Helianthus annuus]